MDVWLRRMEGRKGDHRGRRKAQGAEGRQLRTSLGTPEGGA